MVDLSNLTREQLVERKQLLERKQQLLSQTDTSPDKATPDQHLSIGERFSGGFRQPEDLQNVREQQRAERGMAPGTPMEPTGFNLENFLDIPGDVADMIGPAFPAIGQIVGNTLGAIIAAKTGGVATPAIVKGGIAGAGLGEAARQFIGENIFKFDQGEIGERAFRIGAEAALGAAGEGLSLGVNKAIRATKWGIMKSANKIIDKGLAGDNKFTKAFAKIVHNLSGDKLNYALEAVKHGDLSVLSKNVADPKFAEQFAKKLFFGKDDNLIKQLHTLSHAKGAKEPIKQLYREFFGLSDEAFETIFAKGVSVDKFNEKTSILKLAKQINTQLDGLIQTTGKELGVARNELAKSARAVDVSEMLTKANTDLANQLVDVGFLVREGGTEFTINPAFASTPTGKSQAQMFGEVIAKFFKTESDDLLVKKAQGGSVEALMELANRGKSGRKAIFNSANPIKFGEFMDTLKSFDIQISGNEFKSIGKLSPELTTYLQSVRGITNTIAEQVGNTKVPHLNQVFRELAEGAAPLRQGTKIKNVDQIEMALKKFANVKSGEATAEAGQQLSGFLNKHLGINFLDDLKMYKAAKEVQKATEIFSRSSTIGKTVGLMHKSFDGTQNIQKINAIKQFIDPVLPADLKLGLWSQRHAVAQALHKDATALLKARFLSGALGLPAIAGATIGGREGALAGSTIGLVGGIALQNPALLRILIRQAAMKQIPVTAAKQLPRGSGAVLTQLLRMAVQEK